MRKKVSVVAAIFVLIAVIAGCGPKTGSESKEYDLTALSNELLESEAFSDILSPVKLEIISPLYGFEAADIDESTVYCSTGATTEEIALFKCKDEAAAKRVLEKAEARAQSQKTIYASYAPAEPAKIDDGYVARDGVYVFYIISDDGDIVRGMMR